MAVAASHGETVAGYRILKQIGAGAMSTVFKAKSQRGGAIVALKVMRDEVLADEKLRLRFAQECQISRQLVHPNLVRVLDFGLDGSKAFLVMEYVEGRSVGEALEQSGRFSEQEALRVTREVGAALAWAHGRNLLHRDVKPDNILLTSAGAARLTDLGLAKCLEADVHLTQTKTSLGTPNFMAPEQFEDARGATVRSDVYGLAATLYNMVTGELPFRARSTRAVASIYAKQLKNEIVAPSKLTPDLSPRVEAAILRGMRAQPAERFASVEEFLHGLAEAALPSAPAAPTAADRASPQPGKRESRRKSRFSCRRAIACSVMHRVWEKVWQGHVANISESGLCLRLGRRFEPGTLLTVHVEGERVKRQSIVVRVVWTRRDTTDQWRLGCHYDQPLTEAEVNDLKA